MKTCVTGGAGLIGSHIADLLVARGDEVIVIDTMEPTGPCHHVDGATILRVDVRDPDLIRYLEGAEVVFHQAALGGFDPNPALMTSVNVVGTVNVAESCRRAGVKRLVIASSQAVYGRGRYQDCGSHGGREVWRRHPSDLRNGKWEMLCQACREPHAPLRLRESYPTDAKSVYAQTKLYAETMALGSEGLEVVALRYALVYGPRQSLRNPYTGICSIFANRLRNGEPPIIFEDGQQTRDFTYVEDVAEANLFVSDHPRTAGRIYNVGTGVATTVYEFANMLCERISPDIRPVMSGEWRPDDARHIVTDPAILNDLGWRPQITVAEGIDRYLTWLQEQSPTPDIYGGAHERLKELGVIS